VTRRVIDWLAEHGDTAAALVLALLVAVLATFDIASSQVVYSAILATLAVLAVAMLRDRSRQQAVARSLDEATTNLAALTTRLDGIAPGEELVRDSRRALDEAMSMGVLVGHEIAHVFAQARKDAQSWAFRGGTGTFTRAVTLPECVGNARRQRRRLAFHLEILDPTDAEVCERYARFRRSLDLARDQTAPWTGERTRLESYATVLAAGWYRQRYSLLEIEVALSDRVTTVRFDLAPACLVVTQEDPHNPALIFRNNSFFYHCYGTELRMSFEQARKVPFEAAGHVILGDEPTANEVRDLFAALRMELDPAYSDETLELMVQKAIHAPNPYS
jgi:hypothetical protein